MTSGIPPHFIVIVPGFMGSKLRDRNTGETLWVDLSTLPWQVWRWNAWLDNLLDKLKYPNANLEPAGMISEVIYAPPWGKLENYERLIKELASMSYRVSEEQCFGFNYPNQSYDESRLDVYAFAYDWRQDNRRSARELGAAIERWRAYHPGKKVWIIAHSNGGVVARWYIEKESGKDTVERLFLMGSPWDGTPKALRMAFNGFDRIFRRKFDLFDIPARTRKIVRTFPSIYQLIPVRNPFLRDADNELVHPFAEGGWLEETVQQQYLSDGERFTRELGTHLSVETYCFFGTRKLTPTSGRVLFGAANRWTEIQWDPEIEVGDGTIPQRSAVHPDAREKLPYPVSHGDIYVDAAVLEKLRFEMIDKYRQDRAVFVGGGLKVVFEHESATDPETGPQDFYSPGEKIKLWASVEKLPEESSSGNSQTPDEQLSPVTNSRIIVNIKWRQPLPGEPDAESSGKLSGMQRGINLTGNPHTPGRYEGYFTAPTVEGFYDLHVSVKVQREKEVNLSELIGVESKPDSSLLKENSEAGANGSSAAN